MTISPKLRERILEANVDVHAAEAAVYELLHSEIYNWYEQRATWSRVSAIDRLVAGHTTRSALDIGCGTGNLLLKFTCLGFDVVGVDVSRQMLDVLSGKGYPADRLLCTDVDSFLENYEGECFDVVAISSVLHHLPDYLDTLSRAVRLLKVGGGLLITHEPLVLMSHTQPELVLRLQKAVSWLASMTFRLTLCLHRVRPPSIDYTFSDFHVKDGIQMQALASLLMHRGLKIIEFECYTTEKAGWGAFLNNRILRRAPNHFSLIAQRWRV